MSVGAVNKQTGDRIPTAGMPAIDDALDLTSVNPVQNAVITAALANKQDKTDNNLQTTDKTVVGAVNELKSGLTNYEATTNAALDLPENTGKNLIPLTLDNIKKANTSGTWSGNDYVINGVTYTVVLTNGVVTSITASGTASANADFYCSDFNTLKAGSYVLNGCASNGSEATYFMLCGEATARLATDTGNGNAFTINADKSARTAIRVYSGYEITGTLTFYPMIRPATITDATFAPYIPSVESRIEAVESGVTELDTKMQRYGKVSFSANKWYNIGYIEKSSLGWSDRHFIIAFSGALIKEVRLRCNPTEGYNNTETSITQIYGTANRLGLKVSQDNLRIDIYIAQGYTGNQIYQILTEGGENPSATFIQPVITDLTDADMTKVG